MTRNNTSTRQGSRFTLIHLLSALLGIMFLVPAVASAADADGFDLELHAGPEVWFEEHWAVKAGRFQQFMETYRQEVYSLARRTSGYRGYTVWTFLQPEGGDAPAPSLFTPGFSRDEFIQPHRAIMLNGEILTERVINIGSLMARTYNVLIVHHMQTWADGANFHNAIAGIYADEHDDESLWEHLSSTLYPHVSNVWTAYFRVINTGYPSDGYPALGPAAPGDADDLNLEPRRGPMVMMEEGWDIRHGKLNEFVEVYERDVYALLRRVPGYRGMTTFTRLPPQNGEPEPPVELGGPDDFVVPYPGLLMDGQIRTDLSINAGALFKDVHNAKVVHYIESWNALSSWMREMTAIYEEENNGADPWDLFQKTLFPLINNHWDFPYRMIETSYMATERTGD